MLKRYARKFSHGERGAVLIETLIVAPILIILAFGFLEFGNMLWQREQLQAGVRDAARYWSRCRQTSGTVNTDCSETIARNIAFYGTPNPVPGTTNFRVPGWDGIPANEFAIGPTKTNLPSSPDRSDTVVASGQVAYQGFLLTMPINLAYTSEMRYIGW